MLFYFNEPATTEIYTLSLHDALPIFFKVMDVIPWPRKRIYRHRNGAYFGSTKKRSDEFRGIGKHDENAVAARDPQFKRSEEHTSELQSRLHLVCRLLLRKKNDRRSDT